MNHDTSPAHLTEDDLVLHYYGEMPAAEETAATKHLGSCASCREEYTSLQRVLGAIDETTFSPGELPPSFERVVWARLEPDLKRERRGWMSWLVLSPAPLALAATVVVLVIGAFLAGRSLSPAPSAPAPSTPKPTPVVISGEQIRERIFLIDLGEHLDRSQMMLVELVSGHETGSIDLAGERARAEQLVADNRLYRVTAEDTGNRAVSELLDEIERVLTEIAASPEQMSVKDLADMRRRIESRDLLFKVRVVSSEVRQRQKETIQRKLDQRS
jgi:hypothetical protein